MIVDWLLHSFGNFVIWLLQFFPELMENDLAVPILNYVQTIVHFGGDLFFLLVPRQAFLVALDVIIAWAIHEPFVQLTFWILKKIPFLGIE